MPKRGEWLMRTAGFVLMTRRENWPMSARHPVFDSLFCSIRDYMFNETPECTLSLGQIYWILWLCFFKSWWEPFANTRRPGQSDEARERCGRYRASQGLLGLSLRAILMEKCQLEMNVAGINLGACTFDSKQLCSQKDEA